MAAGYPVYCATCGEDIVAGDAHIAISTLGADYHVLYCSTCCPHDHTRPGHLAAALAAEHRATGRKKRRRFRGAA